MAYLDVSEVLDDPAFQASFSLIASTATVDTTGTNQIVYAAPVIVRGVVQPTSGIDLQRLPDTARQTGSIKIYTRFRLNQDVAEVLASDGVTITTPGTQSDRVLWDGSTYTVMTCSPWLYGSGYFESLAVLTTLS